MKLDTHSIFFLKREPGFQHSWIILQLLIDFTNINICPTFTSAVFPTARLPDHV